MRGNKGDEMKANVGGNMNRDNIRKERGYTLIEMAIVISVLGMIVAAFVSAYALYHKNQVEITTLSNANRVVNALGHFLVQNGRYPCPARMDVARDDVA